MKQDLFDSFGFKKNAGYRVLKDWDTARTQAASGYIDSEVQVKLDAGNIEQAELIENGKESLQDDAAR